MKIFLLLLSFSFLHADYLYTKSNTDYCVFNLVVGNKIVVTNRADYSTMTIKNTNQLTDGYILKDGVCVEDMTYKTTYLDPEHFSFVMALSGTMVGFVFMFLTLFLISISGRR